MSKAKGLPIHIIGLPVLKEKCKDIEDLSTIPGIADQLIETVKSTHNGVGISAPQVGLPIRMFVTCDNQKGDFKVYVNPVILKLKGSKKKDMEGCLSSPGVFLIIERWQKVRIMYLDIQGNECEEVIKGWDARIIQHEYDHLDGIMFYDRYDKDLDEVTLEKIAKLKKGELPEEVKYPTKVAGDE